MIKRNPIRVWSHVGMVGRSCLALVLAGVLGVAAGGGVQASPEGESGDVAAPSVVDPAAFQSDVAASNAYEAQLAARATGEPVEDVSQRTESSQVFAIPDGTWVLSDYTGLNWVETGGDGSSVDDWSVPDPTLTVSPDGWVRPRVSPVEVVLAPGGGPTDTILTTAMGESGVRLSVLWDGSVLPPVVLDGARAKYRNVWPGVDYVVEVTPSGFEQFYVLKTRAAARARVDGLYLDVAVEGGSIVDTGEGPHVIVDAAGVEVGTVPLAAVWDATEDDKHTSPVLQPWSKEIHLSPGFAVPGGMAPKGVRDAVERATRGLAVAEDLPVEVEVTSVERGSRLSFGVDKGWLEEASTEYPVVVDPGVSSTWASGDMYVRSSVPNSQYGGEYELRVGSADGGVTGSATYLNFNTSTIKSLDLTNVYLYLYNYYSYTCPAQLWQVVWVAPYSGATTWNNPTSSYGYGAQSWETHGYSSSCPGAWSGVEVTGIAKLWQLEANNSQGFLVLPGSWTNRLQWKRFYSYEKSPVGTYPPHIAYYYNRAPGAPTDIKIDTQALTENVASTVVRPEVSATVTDPDGGMVQALFTIKQGGVVIVDSLPGSTVSSGGVSSVTLPYALASNVAYTIEVQVTDTRLTGAVTAPTATFTGPVTSGRDLSPDWDDKTEVA